MKYVAEFSEQWNDGRLWRKIYPILGFLIGVFLIGFCSAISALESDEAVARLQGIHSNLHLIHGNLSEEYPEQLMVARFLEADAKVLEIGANVGRNSCVIGSILSDSRNLVCVESFPESAKLLKENRDANGLSFNIVTAAISKVPLVQNGWQTFPSIRNKPGYTRVKTTTFNKVQRKFNITFDTLVVDCEGALYQMLFDDPAILRNIKLVVIENDFFETAQMQYVHNLFKSNGLKLVYNEAGGWGPCYNNFYQVWKK